MAGITIRNIEDSLKSRLRIQAAFRSRSMEDKARDILRSALNREPARSGSLAVSTRDRFSRHGGVELPALPREPMRKLPGFGPWTCSAPETVLQKPPAKALLFAKFRGINPFEPSEHVLCPHRPRSKRASSLLFRAT